jgi:hypothetical protein
MEQVYDDFEKRATLDEPSWAINRGINISGAGWWILYRHEEEAVRGDNSNILNNGFWFYAVKELSCAYKFNPIKENRFASTPHLKETRIQLRKQRLKHP